MALAGIPISENECIGDSLQTINNALTTLDTAVTAAAGSGVTQIVAGSNISISPTGGTGVVTINGAEAGASVTVQSTPPTSPSEGDLWFDNDSGILSMYYDSTWVDVGGGDSGTSAGSVNGIVKSDGAGNFSAAVAGTDYLTLSDLSQGAIIQSVFDTDNTRITNDANIYIPPDDTIPQITEGKEYLSVTITPKYSTSKIKIHANVICGLVNGGDFTVAVFRSGNNNALIATRGISNFDTGVNHLVIDQPNTTSPVTYSVRIGGEVSTSDVCFNMLYAIEKYGDPGAFRSTILVQEIKQ